MAGTSTRESSVAVAVSAGRAVALRLAVLAMLAFTLRGYAAEPGSTGAASGTSEPAHWVKKKLNFTYQGFTTHYSCEGLRDAVRGVLLELGARRSDLKVHAVGCTRGLGQPEPAPSVAGNFYVLEPAPSSAEHPVEAAWQRVNVRIGRSGLDAAGQCELVDQVKHKILPLFSTRNVEFKENCVPHQLMLNGSSLSVEVLKPTRHE